LYPSKLVAVDAIKKKNLISISSVLCGSCIISLLGLFKDSFRFCFRYWYPTHGFVKTVGVSNLMLTVEFCWFIFFLAASGSQKKKHEFVNLKEKLEECLVKHIEWSFIIPANTTGASRYFEVICSALEP